MCREGLHLDEPISLNDFPEICRVADSLATKRQGIYRLWVATIAVVPIFGAAILGLTRSRLGVSVVMGLAIVQTLTLLRLSQQGWNHSWYLNRALVESVKSLTWRFGVCGSPFPQTMPLNEARTALLLAVSEVIQETTSNDKFDLYLTNPIHDVPKFDSLRESSLDIRIQKYRDHRLHNQESWYAQRVVRLRKQRRVIDVLSTSGSIVATGLCLLLIIQPATFDPLLIVGAVMIPIGAIAFGQSLNLDSDVSAYSLTKSEIRKILLLEPPKLENDWPAWVDDIEEVFSREHVLWLASRNTSC